MKNESTAADVYNELLEERKRQHEKFGEQNHEPIEFCAILAEEVGEVNQALVDAHFGYKPKHDALANYRTEIIQVGAVALQMIEVEQRAKPLTGPGFKAADLYFGGEARQHHLEVALKLAGKTGTSAVVASVPALTTSLSSVTQAVNKIFNAPQALERQYTHRLLLMVEQTIMLALDFDKRADAGEFNY